MEALNMAQADSPEFRETFFWGGLGASALTTRLGLPGLSSSFPRPDPTHNQVMVIWQLYLSLSLSVQDKPPQVWWSKMVGVVCYVTSRKAQ